MAEGGSDEGGSEEAKGVMMNKHTASQPTKQAAVTFATDGDTRPAFPP